MSEREPFDHRAGVDIHRPLRFRWWCEKCHREGSMIVTRLDAMSAPIVRAEKAHAELSPICIGRAGGELSLEPGKYRRCGAFWFDDPLNGGPHQPWPPKP